MAYSFLQTLLIVVLVGVVCLRLYIWMYPRSYVPVKGLNKDKTFCSLKK